MKYGSVLTAASLWTNIITSGELVGSNLDKNDELEGEWEIVTREPVCVHTDPPPVT